MIHSCGGASRVLWRDSGDDTRRRYASRTRVCTKCGAEFRTLEYPAENLKAAGAAHLMRLMEDQENDALRKLRQAGTDPGE